MADDFVGVANANGLGGAVAEEGDAAAGLGAVEGEARDGDGVVEEAGDIGGAGVAAGARKVEAVGVGELGLAEAEAGAEAVHLGDKGAQGGAAQADRGEFGAEVGAEGFSGEIVGGHHGGAEGISDAEAIAGLEAQRAGDAEPQDAGGDDHDFVNVGGGSAEVIEDDYRGGDFGEAGDGALLVGLEGEEDASVVGVGDDVGGHSRVDGADVGQGVGGAAPASLEGDAAWEKGQGAQSSQEAEEGSQSHRTGGQGRGRVPLRRASPRCNVECAAASGQGRGAKKPGLGGPGSVRAGSSVGTFDADGDVAVAVVDLVDLLKGVEEFLLAAHFL